MLPLRRLGYILFIVIGISSLFMIYNINEKNNETVLISNKSIEKKDVLVCQETISTQSEIHFYVVGNGEKDIYKDIYQNICQVMEDLKVSWSQIDRIEKELQDSNAVIVFCDDVLSKYVDLQRLATFVEDGGKVVLAAGVAEGYQDAYLHPILGIIEKTIKENYNQFNVSKGFFPLQDDVMTYDGYNISSWMNVKNDAEIFIQDDETNVPIVYTYPYGDGKTLIINATFMSDRRCSGVLTAGLGELLDGFVYPVLGVECVFLDNFPIVTYINDSACMKLYGRSTEAFVRDVVWPVFQGIAVRNDIKYTSSVLSVSEGKGVFPNVSDSLFNTIGKSALQYNGEMAYAADSTNVDKIYLNDNFIQRFDTTFPNYTIEAMVMVNGESIPETITALGRDIKTVRGKLSADSNKARMALCDEYIVFPEATNGIKLDEGNMFAIASILSSHGIVSHTFDVNSIMTIDEMDARWDKDKRQLSEFEKRVFSKTDYLQKVSLSETVNMLMSYLGMEYTWEKEGNTIKIMSDRITEGQPFWVRTKGKIVKAEGAEYVMVTEGYYCVRLKKTSALLILE